MSFGVAARPERIVSAGTIATPPGVRLIASRASSTVGAVSDGAAVAPDPQRRRLDRRVRGERARREDEREQRAAAYLAHRFSAPAARRDG